MPTIVCPGCQASLKLTNTAGKNCDVRSVRPEFAWMRQARFPSSRKPSAVSPKLRKPESASAGGDLFDRHWGRAGQRPACCGLGRATSRTSPKKSGPPGGGLIAEQDAESLSVSPARERDVAVDYLAAEARAAAIPR